MRIDLNADLGEGGDQDEALLALVSSANICCGAHAGNSETIGQALRSAREYGVAVGAHPGYADPEHFGRRPLQLSERELATQLQEQLQRLRALAADHQLTLAHIKPHGALYNQAARDRDFARRLVAILAEFDASLTLVAPAGSELLTAGVQAGLTTRAEAFADRRYDDDGQLLSRSDPRALISDASEAIEQSLRLVREGTLYSVNGRRLELQADTLCLHGDTPEALAFARSLHEAFARASIEVTHSRQPGTRTTRNPEPPS